MSTSPAVPQFIVIPRTGIQMCRRIPLRHIDLLPEGTKQSVWNAAQKIGVTPLGAPETGKLNSMVKAIGKRPEANILLPLVAKYACCDDIETTGWLACDETNAAFFRLVKIGASFYADLMIDTHAPGVSMVNNRVPCIISYGTALLKREQEVCNFFVEDYTKPKSIVGTLVVDYGNSGFAAIFCPDDTTPGAVKAMTLPTPFDIPESAEFETVRAANPILKSTMFTLWAPESELTPPWVVYGNRGESLIGTEDPLITSLYAPKKYIRDWPDHLKSMEPTTRFRGVIGQRDGLFPKLLFVQHGIDQLLELVLSALTNPNRSSISPDLYPQVRKLLLTYPLTWRAKELELFKKMFSEAADRLLQQDEGIQQQFEVELVCSEPVAVATHALWEHLYYYFSYGDNGRNLKRPSLASSTLGNLDGEPHLRVLVVDIGGGSTDIALLDTNWEVISSEDDTDHVEVTFQQLEWARFNRAGDRISHILATAIYEYMRMRYQIKEKLDFDEQAINPGFTLERKRAVVSMLMKLAETAKASVATTGKPWKLTKEDEEVLINQFGPVASIIDNEIDESSSSLEITLPMIKSWVESDRCSKATSGEPGFMDIFVYLEDLATQSRENNQEINLVVLSGRTTRLPFIREFACDALKVPWHRIRTVGDLLPDGLKTPDHTNIDKLAVVYGGHLFQNGGPIRFSFSTPVTAEHFHRFIGTVTDTPSGMKLGKILVSPGDSAPLTFQIKVPPHSRIRIGQAFRENSAVEMLGVVHNTSTEEREIDLDLIADFHVEMKRNKNSELVNYTEWVAGGANEIRDNFNDTGRIDCEPEGFIREILIANKKN